MSDDGFSPLEDKTSCQKWQRNWTQERSLIGGKKYFVVTIVNKPETSPMSSLFQSGILLMINSGMHVSWSIFNGEFGSQAWTEDATILEVLFIQISFFVGAIVGGFNSGYFVDSLGRRRVIVSVLEVRL